MANAYPHSIRIVRHGTLAEVTDLACELAANGIALDYTVRADFSMEKKLLDIEISIPDQAAHVLYNLKYHE